MGVFPHKDDNPFFQLDRHKGMFSPPLLPMLNPAPVPGWAMHVGVGVLNMGTGHKDNKGKVLADGARMVSVGHAVKMAIIPHVNVHPSIPTELPPIPGALNLLTPVLVLGSSSTCKFPSGTVLGPDGPIAAAVGRTIGYNIACSEPVSLPTSIVVTGGTVEVGFSIGDLVSGIVSIVLQMAFDKASSKFGSTKSRVTDKVPDGVKNRIGRALLGSSAVSDKLAKEVGKKTTEALAGAVLTPLMDSLSAEDKMVVATVTMLDEPAVALELAQDTIKKMTLDTVSELLDPDSQVGSASGTSGA